MPRSRSSAPGFLQEIMNTVKPASVRYFMSEFFGERSRI
jgi:hypothetical protein